MKKISIFVLVVICIATNSLVAQKYSVSISGGFGLPFSKEKIDNGDYSIRAHDIEVSFGKGTKGFVKFDYAIQKYVSLNIALGYHYGSSYINPSEDYWYWDADTAGVQHNIENTTTRWNHNTQFQLIPGIKISSIGRVKCYLNAGFVLGFGGKMNVTYNSTDHVWKYPGTNYYFNIVNETKYTKGITMGAAFGLGADVLIAKDFYFFVEVSLVKMEWSRANVETIETINSVPVANNTSTKQFTNKPFSSINLLGGVRWAFGKKAVNVAAPTI